MAKNSITGMRFWAWLGIVWDCPRSDHFILLIRSLFSFLFCFLFTSYDFQRSWLTYRFTVGLKTLTTKKCNLKTTRTIINSSLIRITHSVLGKRFNTQLLQLWLWLKVTKPPFGHLTAFCKLKVLPQAQWLSLGIRFNLQPYLIDSRSQKFVYLEYTLLLWWKALWVKKTKQFRDLDSFVFFLLSSLLFLWFR